MTVEIMAEEPEFDIVNHTVETDDSHSDDEHFNNVADCGSIPVWQDKDDEMEITPFVPLIHGKDSDDEEFDSDYEVHVKRTRLLDKNSKLINKNRILIKRLNYANIERPARAEISSVDFNKKFELLLNSSIDTSLSVFKVDRKQCELLKDFVFERFPIHNAKFLNCGEKIFMTSEESPYFRIFNLETNTESRSSKILENNEKITSFAMPSRSKNQVAIGSSDGKVILIDLRTLDKTSVLYSSGSTRCLAFSDDDQLLASGTDSGEVFIYSNGKISSRWRDHGNRKEITSLSFSPNSRWISCGSYSGIVNIYNYVDTCNIDSPIPTKVCDQLKQSVNCTVFSNDSNNLFISSKMDKASYRLINIDQMTAYENFPIMKGLEETVTCCAFSPNNSYMNLGLKSGKSIMYSLEKYKNY